MIIFVDDIFLVKKATEKYKNYFTKEWKSSSMNR